MRSAILVSIVTAALTGACGSGGSTHPYIPIGNPNADLSDPTLLDEDGGGGGGADLSMPIGDPDADRDGDGFSPNKGDCDDNNNTIFPGAPELCDMLDHNCNGIVDDICD